MSSKTGSLNKEIMFQSILNHYFDSIPAASILPLSFKALTPYDYHLYLCVFQDRHYVVVETDYLSGLPGIARDAEEAFSVIAEGWCVLTEHQEEAGRNMLPSDVDDCDSGGADDENYRNYLYTVLKTHGMRYAVLSANHK